MLNQRLKTIRESLKLSQREVAEKVGVTITAWQNYESGKNIPGGNVLAALCEMGININWVLAGRGSMYLSVSDYLTDNEAAMSELAKQRTRDALLAELGLGDLMSRAALSHIADEWQIHTVLVSHFPNACTLDELEAGVQKRGSQLNQRHLLQLLNLLRSRGLVKEIPGIPMRFQAAAKHGAMVARDITGHAHATIAAVRTLVRDVLPRSELDPPKGRILQARFSIRNDRGAEVMSRLRNVIKEVCEEVEDPSGQDELVFAAGMGHIERKKVS